MEHAEYEALRNEIVEWQARRMTIATGTVVVVTAVLGWIVQSPHRWMWPAGSAVVLAAIASAAGLTWIFGLNAVRLGTYLQTFHEPRGHAWESRNAKFRGRAWKGLNSGLAGMYSTLALVSIFVPRIAADRHPSTGSYVVFGAALALAVVGVALVLSLQGEREAALRRWQEIREGEAGGG